MYVCWGLGEPTDPLFELMKSEELFFIIIVSIMLLGEGPQGRWPKKICLEVIKLPMPPSQLTLAKPKSFVSKTTAFTPSTLHDAEPSWQMMWHGSKVEVLSRKHRPVFSIEVFSVLQMRFSPSKCTSHKIITLWNATPN